MKEIKFIDLFAGIGGFRYSLPKCGCKCVFSSEINDACREEIGRASCRERV